MRGYVLINARTGEEKEVARTLERVEGVVKADYTFGTYDVIVQIEAPNLAAIGKLVFETIRETPGVVDTMTCLAVE